MVAKAENHWQTYDTKFDPALANHIHASENNVEPLNMSERKIIAYRAIMELSSRDIVNLRVGIPESIAKVAVEEGLSSLNLTVESGAVGGIPSGGLSFGSSLNADCILDEPYQFDFYHGGGLDIAFLGMGQCDKYGNVNVSEFGGNAPGCGGFIDISQSAKKVVFCGTFTSNRTNKFVDTVEHITFSGDYAKENGRKVLYLTERSVFELKKEGLTLIEIDPDIIIERDILPYMEFIPLIAKDLKYLDAQLFKD